MVLMTGSDLFGDLPKGDDFETNTERQRQAWEQYKAQIMAEWAQERNVGHRPYAYWLFEIGQKAPSCHKERWALLDKLGLLESWERLKIAALLDPDVSD